MTKEIVVRVTDRARAIPEAKRDSGGPRSGTCREDGCLEAPRENKPYCSKHVHKMPYAAQVMKNLERQDQEKSGKRPPKRLLKEAALLIVAFGQPKISNEKLAQLLHCPEIVAERVAEALKLKRERGKGGRPVWRIREAV